MRNRELVVYLHGVRAGLLTARRSGKVVFTFDEQYREGPGQTRLSFSLPMAQLRHSEARSTAFFRGLLTDNDDLLTGYSDRWILAGNDLPETPDEDVYAEMVGPENLSKKGYKIAVSLGYWG